MIELVVKWFEPVSTSREYSREQYLFLLVLLTVGAVLRFWGLGNVGLHGDEETMAMPAMAILESGRAVLPSGMFYPRALVQIYLMSGAVWLFGESEWAFRLPSAILGSFTGLAAFFMGRRFLSPNFNLAFAATVTFLPSMIEISQTARMYVFFVTCIMWFAACLFRWERDQRDLSLILALFVWFVCLHFHTLAVFAAPLFLYPGLSRQSWTQILRGAAALVTCGVGYVFYDAWISRAYPQSSERPTVPDVEVSASPLEILVSQSTLLVVLSLLLIIFAVGLFLQFSDREKRANMLPVGLVALGLVAMALLHYHVGGILLMFGIVFWLRAPRLPNSWLVVPLLGAALMTLLHLGILYGSGLYPGRKLIGAMIGAPSIWPVLRFLEYSPLSGAIYGFVLLFALYRFSKGQRLPIHFLFFAMAVWVPLLIIGFFAWYIPPRYAQGQLGYFLVCVFAGAAFLIQNQKWVKDSLSANRLMALGLVAATVAFINPLNLIHVVNPGYDRHPDHKGAAEYIKSLNLSDDAILIAEDILQQTYYLGKVDYSLRPIDDARKFSIVRDGLVLDQYTGAIVLGDGDALNEVIATSPGKPLYIIGSGENWVDGTRLFRSRGIDEALSSPRLDVVYTGRDGKTTVWRRRDS